MKTDNIDFSLSSVGFILQHPWLFVLPIIIVFSLTVAYVSSLPLVYSSDAIVLYELKRSGVITDKYLDTQKEIFGSILAGDNLRHIVKEAWPGLDEINDPGKFNGLMDTLRVGIRLEQDKDRGVGYYSISFADTDPNVCYEVVLATVNTIKWASKKKAETEVESGIAFLKQQLEFYKEKNDAITREGTKIKMQLLQNYNKLSDNEREVIDEVINVGRLRGRAVQTEIKIKQGASIEDNLSRYNLQLAELKKRKASIQDKIDRGDNQAGPLTPEQIELDNYVRSYTTAISNKMLLLTESLSKGFTSEHPYIKKIQDEIAQLEVLKEQRTEELMDPSKVPSNIKRLVEKSREKQLNDINSQIESVNMKLGMLQQSKQQFEASIGIQDHTQSPYLTMAMKLIELIGESEINRKYYGDLRQQLELAEIKNRAERSDAGIKISVIEDPRMPRSPIPMQKTKPILFGIMLGVILGLGISYTVTAFDKSIKSSSELRELLQIPVMASIDRISMPQEITARSTRRNIYIVGVAIFIVLSPFIVRIFERLASR